MNIAGTEIGHPVLRSIAIVLLLNVCVVVRQIVKKRR